MAFAARLVATLIQIDLLQSLRSASCLCRWLSLL